MSGLNRMARIKGAVGWMGFGEVTHIQAAAKMAELHYGIDEIEIEVRCSTDAPDTKPCCFKMKRRVVWDCLNPRQGADDVKQEGAVPPLVTLHRSRPHSITVDDPGCQATTEEVVAYVRELAMERMSGDATKPAQKTPYFKWLEDNAKDLEAGFKSLLLRWSVSINGTTVAKDEWNRLVHKSQRSFSRVDGPLPVSHFTERLVQSVVMLQTDHKELVECLRHLSAKTPSSFGRCVPHAKVEAKQGTSDPIGKSPVEAARKWFWTHEEMKEKAAVMPSPIWPETTGVHPHGSYKPAHVGVPSGSTVEPAKSDARKISYGFEKLHDIWLEKTGCQPEHGCFQEFVSLLCILSEIEKEKDWIDVVIRLAGDYAKKRFDLPLDVPYPTKKWSMLEWLKWQQDIAQMQEAGIPTYKPDGGWSRDQWLGQNGPGSAKVQVALPPKVPLRSKKDYPQELHFGVLVVDLDSSDYQAITESRLRRKTQVAG